MCIALATAAAVAATVALAMWYLHGKERGANRRARGELADLAQFLERHPHLFDADETGHLGTLVYRAFRVLEEA
jgi:hypothetical protein